MATTDRRKRLRDKEAIARAAYHRDGGLWQRLDEARSRDDGTADEIKREILRLSEERARLWTNDPTEARRISRVLNGHDHDAQEPGPSTSVRSFQPWIEPRLLSSSEAAKQRKDMRLRKYRNSAPQKDRDAARAPLWDEYGMVCPGLIGLGIVPTPPGYRYGPKYPGLWSQLRTEYDTAAPKPRSTVRADREAEDIARIREIINREISRTYGPREPSAHEVARELNTTNRERIGRLMKQVEAELLTEFRAARVAAETSEQLQGINRKLDLLLKSVGADRAPVLRLVGSNNIGKAISS